MPLSPSVLRYLPFLGALLLLALVLTAFFWDVTVRHKVLSGGDLIFISYPWLADLPSGYGHPDNIYQSDDAFLGYPARYVMVQTVKEQGLVHWQPFHLSGTPTSFPTDFLGYVFYPPSWLYFFLPFHVANSAFHMVVLFVAGLGMYLLLGHLRLPRLSALYGALLFMLNGHFIVWLGAIGLAAILGLVPLIIFGFERYQDRGQRLYLLIPAGCLAMQIFLGYAPGWVVSGTVLLIYGLVRLMPAFWARQFGAALRQAGVYLATAALGLLLASYALVPTVAASLASDYQTERQGGLAKLTPENAWTYLFPDYWGTPEVPVWLGAGGNYPEWVSYFGITAAPLALVGLWRLRRCWVAWFAVGVLAFTLAQIYGIPPLSYLANLPGLRQTANTRWNYGVPLAVSILAALGMAFLLGEKGSTRGRLVPATAVAGAVLTALVSVALLGFYRGDADTLRFITEGGGLVPSASDLSTLLSDVSTHLHKQLALLLGAGALCVLALFVRPTWGAFIAPLLVLLTLADLFGFGSGYSATVKRGDLYPQTPGLAFLQGDPDLFRIAPVGGPFTILPGYTANLYGLQVITGYDHYRDQEYLDFLGPLLSPADVEFANLYGYVNLASDQRPLNRNVLSLLNVRYVVAAPNGLLYADGGQTEYDTPYPLYGNIRQGQLLTAPRGRVDRVELLLATGGGPGPDSPVTFHFKGAPHEAEDLYVYTVPGTQIQDNAWFAVDLPAITIDRQEIFLEIEAPALSAERPLYVWGLADSALPGSQRWESGAPARGGLAYRVFSRPSDPWLDLAYQGGDLAIYRVETTLPRAWGVGEAEVLATQQQVMDRITRDEFDPAATVAFAAEDLPANLPLGAGEGSFQADIVEYGGDALTAETDFSRSGFLVLSERFEEGWQAEVDGADAPVLRGNGVLRVVPVGEGQHSVRLSFRSREYLWGARISLLTAVLTGLGLALYLGRHVSSRFAGWPRR